MSSETPIRSRFALRWMLTLSRLGTRTADRISVALSVAGRPTRFFFLGNGPPPRTTKKLGGGLGPARARPRPK